MGAACKTNFFLRLSLIALSFLLLLANPTHALRCGNKLVNEGDKKIEVLNKCGEPALIEKWREERFVYKTTINSDSLVKKERVDSEGVRLVEEWTYNFGANRFLYFLTFVNGTLTDITSSAYGYDGPIPADSSHTNCGKMLEIGDRKINVLMKCGEPTIKDVREDEKITSLEDKEAGIKRKNNLQVMIDEWSYNFGPNHFLLFIEFENGRAVNFKQRGYGF